MTLTIWTLVLFCLIATFLPFTKYPHGAVQGLGFIRLQMLFLMAIVSVGSVVYLEGSSLILAVTLLFTSGITNLLYIAKFTPIWRVQSLQADQGRTETQLHQFTVIVANVKQSNRFYRRFLRMVETEEPDILLVVETNQTWLDAIGHLKQKYLYHVEVPHDTGYGMAIYSTLKLTETCVAELVTEGVPSIRAAVHLSDGGRFRLYAVHPEPPVPYDHTKARDGEIALVGLQAKEDPLPAIVTGDLNDVAWSTTTRRFQRLSGLLDPRVGRGFYATFNAFYPIFRWPLDHLFHNPRFRLVEMRRLPSINSDHFPMLFSLMLTGCEGDAVLPDDPRKDEVEEVEELISEAQEEDREPVGTDWEQE